MIVRVNLFLPTKDNIMKILFKIFNKLKKLFSCFFKPTVISNTNTDTECWVKVDEYPNYLVSNKGRYGTYNPYSVLSKKKVEYILTHYKPRDKKFGARALARKFGVHHKTVLDVIQKKRYVINGEFAEVQDS